MPGGWLTTANDPPADALVVFQGEDRNAGVDTSLDPAYTRHDSTPQISMAQNY